MQVRALVLLVALPCGAQSLYPQRASAPVGAASLALADCDHDGRLDLLTAPGNTAPLALRGDGAQGFESWLALAMQDPGEALVAADFDVDGNVDVAVARTTAGCAVFRGLGASGFLPAPNLALASVPHALARGDLDGDGDLDLAWLTSSVLVGVARGDGALGFTVSSSAAVGEAGSLACLDLDGDGRLDVIHAARPTFHTGELVSRAVDAQGQLGPQLPLHAMGLLYVWTAGDLDADGDLDVVVQEEPSLALTVLANTNGALAPASSPFTTRRARDLAIADVNADGRADLLAAADGATASDPALERWIGLGGLTLGPQLVTRELAKPSSVAVADLEGDGTLEIVAGHSGAGARVSVTRVQSGTLVAPTRVPLADEPLALASVDWNRDGAADIAVATANELVFALGNGQGGIGASALPLTASSPGGFAIGD
ncbi:MAG: VCBS repeat-containing protein, partial [Planctomycetota bacterium]